jgi:hypothetical protein
LRSNLNCPWDYESRFKPNQKPTAIFVIATGLELLLVFFAKSFPGRLRTFLPDSNKDNNSDRDIDPSLISLSALAVQRESAL